MKHFNTTVSGTLSWNVKNCRRLNIFQIKPFERILDGDHCLPGMMETSENGIKHRLVIKVVQRNESI